MAKILYIVYSLVVISVMCKFSYGSGAFLSNANSYYHGGSSSGAGYSGTGSSGHK